MNKKQRQTLKAVFSSPVRSDIKWTDIENLFKALGAEVSQGKGSRVRVVLNGVKAVFHEPHPERETVEPPSVGDAGFPYRLLSRPKSPTDRHYWAVCFTSKGAPTSEGFKYFISLFSLWFYIF